MRFDNKKVLTGTLLSLLLSAVATSPAFARPSDQIAGRQPVSRVETTQTIAGTIKSIVGEVVTLNLDNGGTETVRISQQVIKINGLVSGTRIAAIVSGDNAIVGDVRIIPNIREVRGEVTRVEVTNKQEETHQTYPRQVVTPTPTPRRTTETVEIRRTQERRVVTPAPAPAPAPAPNVEPSRPVRGMW